MSIFDSAASGLVSIGKASFVWGLSSSVWELVKIDISDGISISFPKTTIFDNILKAIVETCIGSGQMAGTSLGSSLDASALFYSKGLFYYLGMMDFVIAIILGLIAFENGPNFLSLFMNKIFKYGFWMFIFLNWRELTTRIGNSFLQIGSFDRDVDVSSYFVLLEPSKYISKGLEYSFGFLEFVIKHDWNHGMKANIVFDASLAWIASFFIFIAFFLIALNMFLTVAEFYICSALMLVFIPFALFEKTERFASQVFNLVICFGVRLMILYALIRMGDSFFGIGSEVQKYFIFKDSPSLIVMVMSIALSTTFAYLCCEAPQMASSVISGALNLNSNNAIMHAYGGAAALGSTVGGAMKVGGTIVGATQRSIDAAKAANGGVIGKSLAAVGGFSDGIQSGIAKGTIGGLEEGQAVYQAASGRTSGHESSTSPGYQVTRDADGNIIRKSGSSDNSGGFTSNHGIAEGISRFVTGKSSGTSQGGSSAGRNSGDVSGGTGKSGGSYVYAPTTAPNQGSSPGVSQEGQRGPQGDFGHQ